MLNSRAVASVVGLLGAVAGVGAVVWSQPVLGLLAGALALAAGAAAVMWPDGATAALEQQIAEHQALGDALRARVDATAARLAEADARVAALEEELDDAQRSSAPVAAASGAMVALTDHDSQLFSEAYFRVALDARIASARRHLRPVAIAIIDVYEGLAGAGPGPANPVRAAESIRQTVRDADTACRLADGTFAIILEDTPENGAVWTVERVRRNLVSRFGSHTMWAGVACYPAHAFSGDELTDQARLALESAREWKQDRIEVAIAE